MAATLGRVTALTAGGEAADTPPPAADRLWRSLLQILDDVPVCAWSTVTPDGRPHTHIAHFAHSADLHLYFLSDPRSSHCRHLAANPSMAVAVFPSSQPWGAPGRGVQLFGTCGEADGGEADGGEAAGRDAGEAERLYALRFPGYGRWKAGLNRDDPAAQYRFYRFGVERLKLLDETEYGDGVIVQADVVRTV